MGNAADLVEAREPACRHGFCQLGSDPGGRVRIEKILEAPPAFVETAKVFDMLMAVPKFGRVKAARFLNQCRISQSKTVGGLSERQRAELIGLFNR